MAGEYIKELSNDQFCKAIATVRKNQATAKQVAYKADQIMERLGIHPNLRATARAGKSDLASHTNVGSLFDWMDKITADDTKAVSQLVSIHATAVQVSQ